ncbi:MAG TPA: DEAD/DEAH box helicase [Negativicutes bacterium]|nr:DEAD/DEAH box helicase [Negativicutes bacterium]
MSDLFTGLGINEALSAGLGKTGITAPTGIQTEVIPLALFGKDVIGQSATGTGKTLAYLLPLFQKIEASKRETQAIILAPTHELAMQIYHQSESLAKNAGLPVTAAPIIGQVNIARQIDMLKGKPHIIVGSSGRILELIQKRKINTQTIKTIIIDEADRMLDDMNWASVKAVVKTTMRDRQMMFFSATITPAALARAGELTRDPQLVAIKGQLEVPADISHMYFVCEQREKIEVLRKLAAHLNGEQALVFINQSEAIEATVMKLNYHGLTAAGIYGTAVKADRHKALADFRSGKVQLLVASDLAARGLDIPGVAYVFNLELPEDPQLYLHRVGRTGRAGQSGTAISLITRKETELIAKFAKVLKIRLVAKHLLKGKIVDTAPPPRSATRSGTK